MVIGLLRRDAVRAARRAERGVEVDRRELRVDRETAVRDLEDVDLVVALEVELAEAVLVEEVVRHDEALVVLGEVDVVRTGAEAEIDDVDLGERGDGCVLGRSHLQSFGNVLDLGDGHR